MRKDFIDRFKSTIIINIKGKNIEKFIKRLISNKIELFKINYPNNREANLRIKYEDYTKVLKLKTIYEIKVVDYNGVIKYRKTIDINKILIVSFLIGLMILITLSNVIYKVEVIHNDKNIRELLIKELKERGIKEHSFVKSFKTIEKIKTSILSEYKDSIEWLEIERVGVKYLVRVEERKLKEPKKQYNFQHIIASKPAIIKRIDATSGEIIKGINDYVKKGDIIVSGNILLNGNIKGKVKSIGTVYGEVWYQITVSYPFVYREEKLTGRTKSRYVFKLINHEFPLLDFNPYKEHQTDDYIIYKNNIIPFIFMKQKEREIKVIDEVNTVETAKVKAISLATKQITDKLSEKEHIIDSKLLSVNVEKSKIICEVFFTVYEDITDYLEIKDEKDVP